MRGDLYERFASSALGIFGSRGPFEIEVEERECAPVVAAFEALECTVQVYREACLKVLPPGWSGVEPNELYDPRRETSAP